MAHGEDEGLQLGMHPKLCQDARYVVALGADAYVEPLGASLAVEALGDGLQDLLFPGCEECYGPAGLVPLFSLVSGEAEQLHNLF